MKVGPHVMTHGHSGHGHHHRHHHDDREVVPRVGSAQAGGNLKLIQCQLMLLLHARRCQQRHELIQARNAEGTAGDDGGSGGNGGGSIPGAGNSVARALLLNCPIRHCRAMKEVLNHMKTCRLGGTCTYQHCTTSLRILSHWTNCTIEDCPLCMLVRMRMTRAKEWEATLPRSSRYTLLAAALRSSQAPRPTPPNCQVAEQAQEGQSGVPCQAELDDLRQQRQWPVLPVVKDDQAEEVNGLACDKKQDKRGGTGTAAGEKCEKCYGNPAAVAGPSLDQVRKAYEQLGIPCPEEALQRLMATLPSSSSQRRSPLQRSSSAPEENEELSTDDNSMDINSDNDNDTRSSNGDQGIFDCYCSSSPNSSSSPSPPPPPQQQQHPIISSTTSSAIPLRLPFKSSR